MRRSLAALLVLAGCTQPALRSRSKVDTPRILAVIAEPPEVSSGGATRVRVMTGGLTPPVRFRWSVCTRPEATTTFTAQSTFGQAEPDQGCGGPSAFDMGIPLGDGPEVSFGLPPGALDNPDLLRAAFGAGLDLSLLRRIVQTVGLPVTVQVEMRSNGVVVTALKRLILRDGAEPNSNPPSPVLRWDVSGEAGAGGVALGRVNDPLDEDRCGPSDGRPLVVRPDQIVELAPDPNEVTWLESYTTLDGRGSTVVARETAFYAWFATDGWFSDDRTRIPTRNTLWHAPYTLGRHQFWVVLRDGRGGASACHFEVQVSATGDALPPDVTDATAQGPG